MKSWMEHNCGTGAGASLLGAMAAKVLSSEASTFVKTVFKADENNTGFITKEEWLRNYHSNPSIKQFMDFATGTNHVDMDSVVGLEQDAAWQKIWMQCPALTEEKKAKIIAKTNH
eukprot:TRINITY_DN2517_c0_g1_i1.p1 TRINITY_DN2517_c0_g1~~TRINITY_DN2517_c0_g1_i1.p1  ORF type:complete len:115 (-),score=37.99 TRINITY_DN2517_c0_g1_i1:740-1084(-)